MKTISSVLLVLMLTYTTSHSQNLTLDSSYPSIAQLSPELSLNLINETELGPSFSINADYAQKAKSQKTIAWILAGAGAGMIIAGIAVGGSDKEDVGDAVDDTFEGAWLIAGGAVLAVASVPLFIISGKNRRKAGLSGSISINSVPDFANSTQSRMATMGVALTFK